MFGGIQKYMYYKKYVHHMKKIPHQRGRKILHHTMPMYPWYVPSMSIVSVLMINDMSEK